MKKFLLSIFAVLFAFAGAQAQETVTFDATAQNYSNQQKITSVTIANGIQATFDKGNGGTAPAYYTSGTAIRLYAKGTLSIESTVGKITNIVFGFGSSDKTNAITADCGTFSTNTWTGESESVVFTIGGTKDHRRFKTITVTYVPNGVSVAADPTVVGGEFVGSTTVVITNNDDDATLYYSVDDGAFEEYDGDFVINKDTKVAAYAQIGDDEETRSATVTAEFTRVAANPVLVYGATSFDDEITVSVTSDDDVYYTLDGTKPNDESTLYEGELTLKATATLKVIAIDAEGYASAVVEQKFTKNESASGAGETTLVTDASTLAVGDQIVIVASDYNYALSTTQNNNNRGQAAVTKDGNNITYGADVQIITLEEGSVDGTFAFNVGTGYLYAASSGSNHLKTKVALDENGSWAISVTDGKASITAPNSSNRNVMQYNQSSSLFSCYTSASQKALSIYKINKASIEAYTLTVGNAGWATLFLNYDAEIPADATCYAVTAVDGESAKLAEVEGTIPSNTAVIVNAEAGEYKFEVAAEAEGVAENELQGTLVNEYKKEEAYVLAVVDGKVGLYKAAMAGGVWLNNANKAYLPASAVPNKSAAFYGFDWNGTTGIENVEGENGNVKAIFDLTGRKVNSITAPGIYIVGGKKVLVK